VAPYMCAPVPAEVPTWIRKSDERVHKRAITKDILGNIVVGKITAILKYSNGKKKIEVKQGRASQRTTTICADPTSVEIL